MTKRVQVKHFFTLLLLSMIFTVTGTVAVAQSSAFTYQGRLTDAGNPATGVFDMQFKLFDTPDTGTGAQLGVVENPSVQITNGVFSVQLDFGAVFDGAARFLEICLRPAGSTDPYTVLEPRQPLTTTPYALRSSASATADGLSVACAGCVTSSQIQSVDGAQVTGSIAGSQITGSIPVESVPTGSGNYIQNSVAALRAGRNAVTQDAGFNITGDGIIGGLLGVGTATPQRKLHVVGISRFENDGKILEITSGTLTDIKASTTSLVLQSLSSAPSTNNNLILNPYTNSGPGPFYNGNIGIGTFFPETKLHVVGSAIRFDNGGGMVMDINAGNINDITARNNSLGLGSQGPPGNNHVILNPFPATGTPPFRNGNVGIGTFFPETKLHVENPGGAEITLRSPNERAIMTLDSTLGGQRRVWTLESGVNARPGAFAIYDRTAMRERLSIDTAGNVGVSVLQITGGADFAENFDVTQAATKSRQLPAIEPGMVVSIDPVNVGKLLLSARAYDRRVAGIISGAGGIKPGLMMGQAGSVADGKHPVALTGRVYCRVDASYGAIKPGDLLTSSATAGHAMKVTNYARAQGAIIGKAMTSLKRGRGLVLVLVTLQ